MCDETLVARLTRPVTMSVRPNDPREPVRDIRLYPTGTEVYVTRIRDGQCNVRVPGALFTATVSLSDVDPNA